jgi:zinc/manganese transport system substrate-binding protein
MGIIAGMFRAIITLLAITVGSSFAAELKVATLHPLLADLAKQVGGEHVDVVDLIGPAGDPHHFEPSPADLKRSEDATLYLASGMGMESYLASLKTILAGRAEILEVGATLPALHATGEPCSHGHHHHHHGHELDPHWWHSIDRFRRATTVVADAFAAALPARADDFKANAAAYRGELDELERWTKREIAKIPRANRHLATAHAAFNYFCADYGFTAHPVQGLNREQMPDPKKLAELIADLKKHQIGAIFPEKESNPKILGTLTEDTGIRLGDPLIADGAGVTVYADMIRHNVTAIVAGLGS